MFCRFISNKSFQGLYFQLDFHVRLFSINNIHRCILLPRSDPASYHQVQNVSTSGRLVLHTSKPEMLDSHAFIVKTRSVPQGTKANTDKHRISCSRGTICIVVSDVMMLSSITTFFESTWSFYSIRMTLDGCRYLTFLFAINNASPVFFTRELTVLYFPHSASVLSLYIDVILTLSIG